MATIKEQNVTLRYAFFIIKALHNTERKKEIKVSKPWRAMVCYTSNICIYVGVILRF